MAWNWELRIGSWGLGAEDWAWSWGSQEESETDAVDVRGKSSQTALLQTDTHKGSGSLGGLWGLGAGSWQLGEHKLEKLAKLGKYGRKLPPTETQGLELKNFQRPLPGNLSP